MDEIEDFARSTRRKTRLRITIVVLILASPIIWLAYTRYQGYARHKAYMEEERRKEQLTDAERADIKREVGRLQTIVTKAKKQWADAFRPDAFDKLSAGASPCAHRFSAPSTQAAASYIKHRSIDRMYFGNARYDFFPLGKPVVPHELNYALEKLGEIASKEKNGTATRQALRDLRRIGDLRDRLVVIGTQKEPFVSPTDDLSYDSGSITGVVMLYSYTGGNIRCIAPLDVRNSATVKATFSYARNNPLDHSYKGRAAMQSALGRDLEVNVMRAIVKQLRVVAAAPASDGGADQGGDK